MAKYISDFRQGDTKTIKVDYGNGVDITGWIFTFELKTDFAKDAVLTVSHTAGDDSADDVSNGLAHITLGSDDTATTPAAKYYYTLSVNKGGSPAVIKTLMPPIKDYKDKVEVVDK